MKKTFLTIALSLMIGWTIAGNDITPAGGSANAPVQMVTLKGKVVDINSGESLTGVEVTIEGTTIKAYTDFDGNFEIKDVMPGTYNLIASYISYKNSLVENFNAGDTENKVDIKLQVSN
jgi:hypothetical protein